MTRKKRAAPIAIERHVSQNAAGGIEYQELSLGSFAYQSGRILNELRWNLEQALVLCRKSCLSAAFHAIGRLQVLTHRLASEASVEKLRKLLKQAKERFESDWSNPALFERFLEIREGLNDDRVSAEEQCRVLCNERVNPTLEVLRAAYNNGILTSRIDRARLCLGELVDQLLRPEDPFRSMWLIEDPDDVTEDFSSDDTSHGLEGAEYRPPPLANYSPPPGTLSMQRGWLDKFTVVCQEARISEGVVSDFCALTSDASSRVVEEAVSKCDQSIISHLATQDMVPTSESSERPEHFAFGPLKGMKKQLASWSLPGKGDPRALITAHKEQRLFLRQNGRYEFEVWFKSQEKYDEAKNRSSLS